MAPRPNWKGYLKLSLVSCPVALYPATSGGERVSFRQINKQTGNRLRQQLVDEVLHGRTLLPCADKLSEIFCFWVELVTRSPCSAFSSPDGQRKSCSILGWALP